jgi:hypothetical protein
LGLLGLAAAAVGAFVEPAQFFRSYLTAYVYWLGLALGSLSLLLLHHLAGGRWGLVTLRILEAGAKTVLPVAVLGVPLVFGLQYLYPWSRPEVVAADPLLQHKSLYLNVPAFLARTALYLAVWVGLGYGAARISLERDRRVAAPAGRGLQRLSAIGLILIVLTSTFASIDWLMSLEPHWYSSLYGLLINGGHVVGALSFVILAVVLLGRRGPLAAALTPRVLNDLGSLLLAAVLIWAYLHFSQWLIIWAANLPDEIVWYLRRLGGGWQWAALGVIGLHFALPFLLLLPRALKRSRFWLGLAAALLLAAHWLDFFWIVRPALDAALRLHWLDAAAVAGLGGAWLGSFIWLFGRHPALPRRALEEPEEAEVGNERSPARPLA